MSSEENVVCPVCTLFLRPGITLKDHLGSHPKQKVINALVSLASKKEVVLTRTSEEPAAVPQQTWAPPMGFPPMPAPPPGNHSFIYQQFMSTTTPPNVVGQYIMPPVFSSPVMCPPYLYHQQQQLFMAGSSSIPPFLSPIVRKPPVIEIPDKPELIAVESSLAEPDKDNDMIIVGIVAEPSSTQKEIDTQTSPESVNERDLNLVEDEVIITPELNILTETDENNGCADELTKSDDIIAEEIKLQNQKHEENDYIEENHEPFDEFCHRSPFNESNEESHGSPSSTTSDYLRVRTDLNKACQTSNLTQLSPLQELQLQPEPSIEESYFNQENVTEMIPIQGPFIQNDLIGNGLVNALHQGDQVIDMDGMQLVLCNDFMGSQLISQVEDFEMNNRNERAVLMNLDGMDTDFGQHFDDSHVPIEDMADESASHESANVSIRADERMPPRGELSGQESNGAASDITWTRVHYENSSATSTSYDLLARETWEGSDYSDSEVPPVQSRNPMENYDPDIDDTPTIVSITEPPLNFKCSTCGQGFKCPKERKEHQLEVHADKSNSNAIIGSKIGVKNVKKLVIKPKRAEIKSENNFDNVFTNRLKLDTNDEGVTPERNNKAEEVEEKKEVKTVVCHVCDAVLADMRSLKRHKLQVHGKGQGVRFKCEICGETMPNEAKYNAHLRIHPLECRLCGKYFYRRQNLHLHMKRHLGIKPYSCDFCQKAFLTKQKLDEHKNTHTGETPVKCNMCPESFKRHSNLVQHRNRYHLNVKVKIKDYICNTCGEVVHSKKKLAWHREIHDLKPKACTHCSEKFIHMSSLTRHMRRAHNERFVPKGDRFSENVECPICKGIYLKSSLEVHIKNHRGERPFTCLICNKDFTTKWNLKLHKWTHAARASKPFKCDQCKGAFIREADYIAHMNSHKSIRPYTCNHCGAQFIRKYNCQRHVKEHEKEKTFACNICGKNFHRSYYLKDHMRVHSGVRPYSCHICGKTSATKSNHNKHVMIHHAKEPVSTEN